MALDLREQDDIIDLFQGKQDLLDRVIRPTGEDSFRNDPLRCLRAVRLAAQLSFKILPETKDGIRQYQHQLKDVSPERIRDEFFRFLAGPNQHTGILSLQLLGLVEYVLPEELSPLQTRLVRNLEDLWSLFLQDHNQDRAASWSKGLLIHRLGRYRENLREYLRQELVPGRSLYQISFALPLLYKPFREVGSLPIHDRFDRIPLSNQEISFIHNGISAAQSWQSLAQASRKDQPVEIYRFFNRYGLAGITSIFLVLCQFLDDRNSEDGQKRWIEHLDLARFFLEGYWEKYQKWVDPPIVLDGNQIQKEFQLQPGPMIGDLLNLLREEQVRSGLKSKEAGLEFLQDHIRETAGSDA
jgi:poly(A) polymerase